MRKTKYVNVSIPEGLADAIDDFITKNPKLDLRSRAQVVNFALRKLFVGENSV
jgi:metal-responsive CopG/Arc/MetJ family transcriptional regulator